VPIHPRVVRYHRLAVSQGVLIVGVEPESPAVRTGLREGDVLVAFKGEAIASIDQLQRRLVAAEIGVTSPLMIVRHTEKLELLVTPEEWEPSVHRN
jgi:S1-C subfamily serine protease